MALKPVCDPPACSLPGPSTSASSFETVDDGACQTGKWHQVLAQLKGSSDSEDRLQEQLQEALECVRVDPQWSQSGIFDLLASARNLALRGQARSARTAAIGLLDFHTMVERYKAGELGDAG